MLPTIQPFCVSITGADDNVRIEDLIALGRIYPFVEWGILHFPEKEGTPHNPTFEWRSECAARCRQHRVRSALHLCISQTFRMLLARQEEISFFYELRQYGRVQANLNGRERAFSHSELIDIYQSLLAHDVPLILQYHEGSAYAIDSLLAALATTSISPPQRVSVLFDASCGKGKSPHAWEKPYSVGNIAIDTGYAGGVSPENIGPVLDAVAQAVSGSRTVPHRYWIDMQSGVRTQGRFDIGKVERVLRVVASRLATFAPMVANAVIGKKN
ncbi:hypothetical protein [Trinickia soli]|uniref:Phosphoribosylanthranilate isomerase n=1 Tax=Trinickia soli TaxID=380675 RepID=A0A2N7W3T1_9BURK|nr:hypothetical protein [Trinickia soli]PMS24066.1 hypothetical protein C0Z19_14645 [Trinickia soli]CAB3701873.1 hypothetical protein LMG24076_03466 [Trinickia soli]